MLKNFHNFFWKKNFLDCQKRLTYVFLTTQFLDACSKTFNDNIVVKLYFKGLFLLRGALIDNDMAAFINQRIYAKTFLALYTQ